MFWDRLPVRNYVRRHCCYRADYRNCCDPNRCYLEGRRRCPTFVAPADVMGKTKRTLECGRVGGGGWEMHFLMGEKGISSG